MKDQPQQSCVKDSVFCFLYYVLMCILHEHIGLPLLNSLHSLLIGKLVGLDYRGIARLYITHALWVHV